MTNRRELMKLFGAGAIITPFGSHVQGKLIKPAEVELAKPETGIVQPFKLEDVAAVTLSVRLRDGSTRLFGSERIVDRMWHLEPPSPLEVTANVAIGSNDDATSPPAGEFIYARCHQISPARLGK